jgi:hypothetical protein
MAEGRQCRFGDGEAVAAVALDRGCVAHPDDREQALCLHHLVRARPLGGMLLTRELTEGGALTRWLRGQPAWKVVEVQTVGDETGE